MDTNPNSSDSLIPKQPVIGAGFASKTPELPATVPCASSSSVSSKTIGPHNIASLRLAAGRSLTGANSYESSDSAALATSSSSSSSSAIGGINSLVSLNLRTTTRRRGPITPAKIQFLILGSSGTGKTSLLRRLANLNVLTDAAAESTIGPDLHRLKCGQVEAIDIGGTDQCYPIAQAYAELFDVFVVMFDITSAESFLYARYWMDYLEQKTQRQKVEASSESCDGTSSKPAKFQPCILLIGNKKDLDCPHQSTDNNSTKSSRQVSKNLARNLALAFDAEYMEISARYDLTLADNILETLERKYEALCASS